MSITSNVRSYADTALSQGKQNVSTLSAKANDYATDLRVQAEKAVNLDAIKAAIEPYVAQAKGYSTTVTERVEGLYNTVKSDKRVGKFVTQAEQLTGVVVETVQDRVVKPVQSLTGLGTKPAAKPAPKAATKATASSAAKPAAKKAPVKKATASRATRA